MTSPEQQSVVERLLARLAGGPPDHARFVGAPLDLEGLDDVVLGQLWAWIRKTSWPTAPPDVHPAVKEASQAITAKARELGLVPVLDAEAAVEVFRTVSRRAWDDAIEQCGYLACEPPAALREEVRRILGPPSQWSTERLDAYKARALMAMAGTLEHLQDLRQRVQAEYAGSAFRLAELDVLEQLSVPALLALAGSRNGYYWPPDRMEVADPAVALTQEPAYIEFARSTLESATGAMDDVHAGRVPYQADRPFTVDDAQVIARAARVAALRDETWYAGLIGRLLPRACVAPTAARTAPSQSLAIALAHSIEGVPTPESVQALREAIAAVRHDGVKKKISRNLKPAERALAARPDVALRMPPTGKIDKKQEAMLAACLEAGWWHPLQWSRADWRDRVLAGAGTRAMAKGLVWTCTPPDGTSTSLMPGADDGADALVFRGGRIERAPLPPEGRFRLWHPASAEPSERRAWQLHMARSRLRQPLRQVFREFYHPLAAEAEAEAERNTCEQFSGHMLSIRPLIGLARKEGWQIHQHGGLVRYFGSVRATFEVAAELYPGLDGSCESLALRFDLRAGRAWRPLPIGQVDAVVYSEACRAVDLLVSVTAFALDDAATSSLPLTAGDLGVHLRADAPAAGRGPVHPRVQRDQRLAYLSHLSLGNMARMRREALEVVFADAIAAGRVVMEERHVKVGDCHVHLATARVTRDGEAVDLSLPEAGGRLAAVPWLPYDEVLLQRVADSVGALLAPGGN